MWTCCTWYHRAPSRSTTHSLSTFPPPIVLCTSFLFRELPPPLHPSSSHSFPARRGPWLLSSERSLHAYQPASPEARSRPFQESPSQKPPRCNHDERRFPI